MCYLIRSDFKTLKTASVRNKRYQPTQVTLIQAIISGINKNICSFSYFIPAPQILSQETLSAEKPIQDNHDSNHQKTWELQTV